MDNTPYDYIPPILSRTAMSPETEEAARFLVEKIGRPLCLELTSSPSRVGHFALGDPLLQISDSSTLHSVCIHDARKNTQYDPITTTGVLKDLIYHAVTDDTIAELVYELMEGEFIENDEHCQANVLVMPGAVWIAHPDPLKKAKKMREFLTRESMPVTIEQIEPGDLGYFAAGTYGSAHEAMEIQRTVQNLRPFWKPLFDVFNELEPQYRGNFRIADPQTAETATFVPAQET